MFSDECGPQISATRPVVCSFREASRWVCQEYRMPSHAFTLRPLWPGFRSTLYIPLFISINPAKLILATNQIWRVDVPMTLFKGSWGVQFISLNQGRSSKSIRCPPSCKKYRSINRTCPAGRTEEPQLRLSHTEVLMQMYLQPWTGLGVWLRHSNTSDIVQER